MLDRLVTPIIAIGLSFLVWVYIRSRDQDVCERDIPLTLQVSPSQAEHFALEHTEPKTVPIAFSGPPSRIREVQNLFRQGALQLRHVVSVPEDKFRDTREASVAVNVRLDAESLPVPTGVHADIPELKKTFSVTLRRIVEVKLPVRLNSLGAARVASVTFEPSTVLVRGPKDVLDKETSIPTTLYVPSEVDADKAELVVPAYPLRVMTKLGDQEVKVSPAFVRATIVLKGAQRIQELTDVPVHFLTPLRFPFRAKFTNERAGTVTLRIRGPNSDGKPAVKAYVDLTARTFGPGLHADEPIRVQLPPGYELLTEPLPRVSIQLEPAELPLVKEGEQAIPP
jgi:hypothetical protein